MTASWPVPSERRTRMELGSFFTSTMINTLIIALVLSLLGTFF
jgi:hypothetical protein